MKITRLARSIRVTTSRWVILITDTGWFEVYTDPTVRSPLGEIYTSDPELVCSGVLSETSELRWEVAPPEEVKKNILRTLTDKRVLEAWRGVKQ
jgi:hypothetical protein